ncbi:MAG: TatD family hydrolase [Anaerolineales bacterium]|nr:TatD family hydrolase [Anaerolineales bacterium]
MTLIDTHCHLDFEAYDDDRTAIIERAVDAGVTRIINPGIDIETSQAAIRLSETNDGVYAAVALHPNSTATWSPEAIAALEMLADHPKVVAIGEIGLDYYWDKSPKAVQRAAFEAQLTLATKLKLPIIIHNREASEDVIAVLQQWLPTLPPELKERPGVLHSFSAPPEIADAALVMGFYLGFTGPITYKKADELRSIAAQVPLDRIVVETDGPFLTPHPYRGQRNEPSYVRFVAERLATLRGMDYEGIVAQTTANAEKLFGLNS